MISSQDSLAKNLSTTQSLEHCTKFVAGFRLGNDGEHVGLAKRFGKIQRRAVFDIKPSWSGMLVKEMTRDRLDMHIQADRVILLLTETMEEIKLIGCMHHFLMNDAEILRKYMVKSKVEIVLTAFENEFRRPSHLTPKKTRITMFNKLKINTELREALKIILENKCLFKYIKKFRPEIDQFPKNLSNSIKKLISVIKDEMYLTAAERRERDEALKSAYVIYEDKRKNITRMEAKLKMQTIEMKTKMDEKRKVVIEMEKEVESVKIEYRNRLEKLIYNSEKSMKIAGEKSGKLQETLSAQAKADQETFDILKTQHYNKERVLRAKFLKTEAQLASWLNKFDADVGDRQEQLDEVNDASDLELIQLTDLKAMFSEQSEIYDAYRLEKDEEDEEILREKISNIKRKRAARIIQQYWRAYRARKLARRRARMARAKARKERKLKK